jgi:hypothetical protein
MEDSSSFKSWWQRLPAWLKGATILVAFPAWLCIVYCVLTGQAKSTSAFAGFASFAVVAILHIVFDDRNRRGIRERHGGIDFGGGE